MKEIMFFDANCRIGCYFNGGPCAENAAALLKEMDYYGVDRALVRHINLDKGAIITLDENIEGYCSMRNIVKEDGSQPKEGDKLAFRVEEFNKNSKRILLSHTKTYAAAKAAEEVSEKDSEAKSTQKAVKKIKANLEKTTLGDISALASLKDEMEKNQ